MVGKRHLESVVVVAYRYSLGAAGLGDVEEQRMRYGEG